MNNKKAKQIRRECNAASIGKPLINYLPYEFKQFNTIKTMSPVSGIVENKTIITKGTPRRLDPNCTRAMYKRVKQGLKRG